MLRFIVFISIFFCLYGCLHLYTFIKAKKALDFQGPWAVLIVFWMALMMAAPILVRILERNEWISPARWLAYAGYMWMGVVFLFVSSSLILDIYGLSLKAVCWTTRWDLSLITPSPRLSLHLPLFAALTIATYGYIEALQIRTEHVTIMTPKLPRQSNGLKIAQISDVHIGLIVGEARLVRILEIIKQEQPDLLVSTGDLVDGQMDDVEGLAALIRDLPVKYGKYAITGNHEFYAGLGDSLAFTEAAGFTLLRGQATTIQGVINIAGVDDPAGGSPGTGVAFEKDLLSDLPGQLFTVLLKHRPTVNKETRRLFDLQLSGHTHKGQIFPFNFVVGLAYPLISGFHALGNRGSLYVSRGTGTWGPPIRFLSPPEVTIIELLPDPSRQVDN